MTQKISQLAKTYTQTKHKSIPQKARPKIKAPPWNGAFKREECWSRVGKNVEINIQASEKNDHPIAKQNSEEHCVWVPFVSEEAREAASDRNGNSVPAKEPMMSWLQ